MNDGTRAFGLLLITFQSSFSDLSVDWMTKLYPAYVPVSGFFV